MWTLFLHLRNFELSLSSVVDFLNTGGQSSNINRMHPLFSCVKDNTASTNGLI